MLRRTALTLLCSWRASGNGVPPRAQRDRRKFCGQTALFQLRLVVSMRKHTRGNLVTGASCGAVRGTTIRTMRAQPTATTIIQTTVTTTTVSAWRALCGRRLSLSCRNPQARTLGLPCGACLSVKSRPSSRVGLLPVRPNKKPARQVW